VIEDENDEGPDGRQANEAKGRIELTPAQTESLRNAVANMQRSIAPQIKLPKFTLPESMLKSFAVVSEIAEAQRAMMLSSLKPILDAQETLAAAWLQTANAITSDLFKSIAPLQSNLNLISAQLTKSMDFSFAQSVTPIVEAFAAQRSAWLKDLGSTVAAIRSCFYPPNLRIIKDLEMTGVEVVVMVDGIALYGLPRTSIAEALIRAAGASERRNILGRRWKTISADCRAAVEGCTSAAVAPYRPFVVVALDALDAGHTAAAQALGGTLVDAIITDYFGDNRYLYTPNKKGTRTKDAYDEFTVRQFIAFAPMWQAYQQFFVNEGDRVPTTFSRNATAHTVSPRQFNRRNAVQALMFACSLLYRLDEEVVGAA